MATRKESESKRTAPSISPEQGVEFLRKQIEAGNKLLTSRPLDRGLLEGWYHTTERIIDKAFGENTPTHQTFYSRGPTLAGWNATSQQEEQQRVSTLRHRITLLGTFIEQLEMDIQLAQRQAEGNRLESPGGTQSRNLFLVHGRDSGPKEEVARFVEKLGFDAVILHEQPNLGRTLFEKLKDHADVAYAVILLTPDDRGCLNAEGETLLPRARQNVVFELGYFLGLLGPKRVCAVLESGVEKPSDIDGLLYVEFRGVGWRFELAREMKAAGLPIDMNNAI